MRRETNELVADKKSGARSELEDWIELFDLRATLDRVRPFTLVPRECLVDLALQVQATFEYQIPGAFVECGVWRGGASFLVAELLRQARARGRRVWMFDSFEGIPPPEQIDGPKALDWATNKDGPWY